MAGNITKRVAKDGTVSYRVRVEVPTGFAGERKQASKTFRTRKEAERGLSAWLVEIDRGTAIEPSKVTVGEILMMWLRDEAAHRVQPTTLEDYRSTITKHLIPALGAIPAQRLQANQIQAFYAQKLAGGTGVRTVQLCHLRLSQAIGWAVRMRVLSTNAASDVKPPTSKSKEPAVWTPEQARSFLERASDVVTHDYIGHTWATLFDVLLATGLRRGEALALTWADIDFDAGTARVARALGTLNSKVVVQEPKTSGSRRVVPLPAGTIEALRKHKARQNEHRLKLGQVWIDAGLVFTCGIGSYLHPSNVDRAFHRIVKAAGVPRIRVHDLRHTFATWALMAGEPPTDVSRILGHARVSITMDIYSHAIPNRRQQVSSTIGDMLYRKSS